MLATKSAAEQARLAAEENARARQTAEQRAPQEAEERATWEQLAAEAEQERQALRARLDAAQRLAEAGPVNFQEVIEQGETAAQKIDLDETATRQIVDQQLRDRGWEADTQKLTYAAGASPAKGRAIAIAEWPTESGPADYALFVGLTCVGVIEAKRRRKNVSAAIDQAERYSRGFFFRNGEAAGGPWDFFRVPFVFATNGRPYLKQIETESGIWFRDARKATNHRRALVDWPTPEGLKGQLDIDRDAAHAALRLRRSTLGFRSGPTSNAPSKKSKRLGSRSSPDAARHGDGHRQDQARDRIALSACSPPSASAAFASSSTAAPLGNRPRRNSRSTKVVSVKTFADIFGLKGLGDVAPGI